MEAMRKSWTDERLDDLSVSVELGFTRADERFEAIDQRFDKIDERFGEIDRQFERVDARFEKVDERFELVDERLHEICDRLKRLEQATISTNLVIIAGLFGVIATQL